MSQGFSTLILDPAEEMADSLARIEDRLLLTDVDDEEEAQIVQGGADAAASLWRNVVDAGNQAANLYSAAKLELAPVLSTPGDLAKVMSDLRRGVNLATGPGLCLPTEWRRMGPAVRAIDLLERCAGASRSEVAEPLRVALRCSAQSCGDQNLVLTDAQCRSYRAFTRMVLVDPLDRFIALGSPPPHLDHGSSLGHGYGGGGHEGLGL